MLSFPWETSLQEGTAAPGAFATAVRTAIPPGDPQEAAPQESVVARVGATEAEQQLRQ